MLKEEIGPGDLLQYHHAPDCMHGDYVYGIVLGNIDKSKPYLMKVAWFDGDVTNETNPISYDETGIILLSKVSPDSSAG